MILDSATPDSVYDVALNMRDADFREVCALSWSDDRREIAEDMAARWGEKPDSVYIAKMNDVPIAIVGWIPVWPSVWSVMMIATDDFRHISTPLTKVICSAIIPMLNRIGARRIECRSIEGHHTAHKWIEFLGMRNRVRLEGFGKGGEDFIVFSWFRDRDGALKFGKGF